MGRLLILIIILLLVGVYIIISSNNINLKDDTDQKTFFKTFTSWLANLFKNLEELTVHAIKQDWLPETNKTKND